MGKERKGIEKSYAHLPVGVRSGLVSEIFSSHA